MISHPELREGEVFWGNATEESFQSFIWVTKRKGHMAFSLVTGERIDGQFPVFVHETELRTYGIDPQNLWFNSAVEPKFFLKAVS